MNLHDLDTRHVSYSFTYSDALVVNLFQRFRVVPCLHVVLTHKPSVAIDMTHSDVQCQFYWLWRRFPSDGAATIIYRSAVFVSTLP